MMAGQAMLNDMLKKQTNNPKGMQANISFLLLKMCNKTYRKTFIKTAKGIPNQRMQSKSKKPLNHNS